MTREIFGWTCYCAHAAHSKSFQKGSKLNIRRILLNSQTLLCTEGDNSCYRNVCKMSVVSFALAVVFIITVKHVCSVNTYHWYNVKNRCLSEQISLMDMWWYNRSGKRRCCTINKSEDTTEKIFCHCNLKQFSPEQVMLKSYDVLIFYIFTTVET